MLHVFVSVGKDYTQVTSDQWNMLHRIYGGGPEILISLQQPASPALSG